jgi:two-component system cell cycle response regulator
MATRPGGPTTDICRVGLDAHSPRADHPCKDMPTAPLFPPLRGSLCRAAIVALRGACVIGLVAYVTRAILWPHSSGALAQHIFEDAIFNGLLVAGALLCLLRGLWIRQERAAWLTLGTGLGAWAAGTILFSADPGIVTGHSFPTAADILWIAFYPAAFLALGLLVRGRTRQFYASLWLDGLIGALAISALAAQFVLPPIVAGTGGDATTVIADLIYPLGDLLLAAFVVGVFGVVGWRPGPVLGTVGAGLLLSAGADGFSLYSAATGGMGSGLFDVLWPASAVVLGWSAWQPTRPSPNVTLDGRRLLAMPWLFGLCALGLLVQRAFGAVHPAAYALAVATVIGVLARMSLTFSENLKLVARSRAEALTDALTGLGNRRSLLLDIDDAARMAGPHERYAVLLFDLNGFKGYNDSYGHPAGDALLARLGDRLVIAVDGRGRAYRLGGDEFCVLARIGDETADDLAAVSIAALCEVGDGFSVSTACGIAVLPDEAQDTSAALAIADRRLYEDKGGGRPAGEQDSTREVLLQVLREREPDLHQHLHGVASLAREVGWAFGLPAEELDVVVRAAELHDVGKVAVPDAILHKPARLEPAERKIIERHSEIGERIIAVAPGLRPVARIVRSSHERWDGTGYPDGLAGEQIPLGARIVAVCDAFDAMTSNRPYQAGIDADSALEELARHARTQFDPVVVTIFTRLMARSRQVAA